VTWPFRNGRSSQKVQDVLSGEDVIHVG